jgi:hypothetical protein
MSEKATPELDPELLSQLQEVRPVQAVMRLRPTIPGRSVPPPAETEATVRQLLERVQQEVGVAPRAFNIFRNLGYFVVDADSLFIRRLLAQDEIASASANRRKASAS